MNIIQALEWRYATKKFDATKKLSDQQIEMVKDILRLTPSSFGLQPWKFIIISDEATKKSLVEHSWGQQQVADASHVIIMCRSNVEPKDMVGHYIKDVMEKTWASSDDLAGYSNMMLWFLSNLTPDAQHIWADKQIYIALGNLMTGLATLEIDSCPMEGFLPEKYDEILGLKEKWLSSVLVLPIGYRHADDDYARKPKIRYDNEEIFSEK